MSLLHTKHTSTDIVITVLYVCHATLVSEENR
jgi:hypothetical protein